MIIRIGFVICVHLNGSSPLSLNLFFVLLRVNTGYGIACPAVGINFMTFIGRSCCYCCKLEERYNRISRAEISAIPVFVPGIPRGRNAYLFRAAGRSYFGFEISN